MSTVFCLNLYFLQGKIFRQYTAERDKIIYLSSYKKWYLDKAIEKGKKNAAEMWARRKKMTVIAKVSKNTLYIYLSGEFDEYNARNVREETDALLERNLNCDRVVFDLSGVKFMDSSGIGFLMGRYKKLKKSSAAMYLQSPDLAADKVLSVSGIYSIIPKL